MKTNARQVCEGGDNSQDLRIENWMPRLRKLAVTPSRSFWSRVKGLFVSKSYTLDFVLENGAIMSSTIRKSRIRRLADFFTTPMSNGANISESPLSSKSQLLPSPLSEILSEATGGILK